MIETHGPFESVWDALEDDLAERERMKVLSDLMMDLRRYIEAQGWTKQRAAQRLAVTPPRITQLLRGRITEFTADDLIGMFGMAGRSLVISYKPSSRPPEVSRAGTRSVR